MSWDVEWISCIATVITAGGIVFAFQQLRLSKEIAQTQFEDGLTKEYRNILCKVPAKALLAEELSEEDYAKAFDALYRYVDLSNEQASLRQRERIGDDVWRFWCDGIKSNLALPAFRRAWSEIKTKRKDLFEELRQLENEDFNSDPKEWGTST